MYIYEARLLQLIRIVIAPYGVFITILLVQIIKLKVMVLIIIHKPVPEPVLLPYPLSHLFNGHILGFREEEEDEERHEQNPGREEDEDAKLEMAKHGKEGLGHDKGEEEVDTDSDALASRPSFHGEGLTGDEPTKGTPRP